MRRVQIATPWFTAVVCVDDFCGLIHSVESCEAYKLVGYRPENLKIELERAATVTDWGRHAVSVTDLAAKVEGVA